VTSRPPRRRTPLVAAAAVALALLALPAHAAPARDAASPEEPCSGGSAARTAGRAADGPTYTPRRLRRIDRDLTQALADQGLRRQSTATARTGLELRIAVHVHVIRGDGARGPKQKRVRRQLDVLDDAYNGGQSADNASTRFSFRLASFERVRNLEWRHASMGSPEDRQMRRTLHLGDAADLNLYVLSPVDPSGQGVVLGWSSSPWQLDGDVRLDGVAVHEESLPGGSLYSYGRGDTAVHEVGHWLGLLHTFEGGCSEPNDLVADTPAQGEPSTTCEAVKDTCALPGEDPVHNFMDYAVDACMDMFTPGQVSRMTDNWLAYRTP
jgi:pregnancy-associated plasma protein-A